MSLDPRPGTPSRRPHPAVRYALGLLVVLLALPDVGCGGAPGVALPKPSVNPTTPALPIPSTQPDPDPEPEPDPEKPCVPNGPFSPNGDPTQPIQVCGEETPKPEEGVCVPNGPFTPNGDPTQPVQVCPGTN